ncbi:hypothetical protein CLOP_g21536 [Closterium sp. NIES-67]|nr:hypothetical protein CLOP_g21536 [Closterium sp. NIES-67]
MATTAVWSLNDKPWPPGSCLDPSMDSRSSDGSTSSSTVDSVRNSILRTVSSSSGGSSGSSARSSMTEMEFSATSLYKEVKIRRTNSCTTTLLDDANHGVRRMDLSSAKSTKGIGLHGVSRSSRGSANHRSSLALIFPQAIEEEESVTRSNNNGEDLQRAERSEANRDDSAGPLADISTTAVTSTEAPEGSSSEHEEDSSAQPTAGQESFLLQETDRAAPSHTPIHSADATTQAPPIVAIGSSSADNPISSIVVGSDHATTGFSASVGTASNAARNRVWDKLCNFIRPYYYQTTSTSAPLLVSPSSNDSHLGSATSGDDRTALRAAAAAAVHHTRSSSYNSRLFCFGMLPPALPIPSVTAPPPPSSRTLLPPLPPHFQLSDGRAVRKTLVLDLDETLVHSSFSAPPAADFVVPLTMDGRTASVYVLKRPGVEQFLATMAPIFEVVVFTASLARYADPVLDLLDPTGELIHHRLFRESCVQMESGGGYVKDLSILGRDLADVLLVDNSPLSYARQPANGVPISSFIDNPRDMELFALIPFLEHMARVSDDVRRHLGGGAWMNVGAGGKSAGMKRQESGCKQAMC